MRDFSAEEIHGVLTDPTNVTDSPELGSPPIAHFEESGPGDSSDLHYSENLLYSGTISVNLESRKRRRESSLQETDKKDSLRLDAARTSDEASAAAMPVSLKAGAKRKLQVRDGEDEDKEATSNLIAAEREKGEFQFSRKRSDTAPRPVLDGSATIKPDQTARSANGKAPGDESLDLDLRATAKVDAQQKKDSDNASDDVASTAVTASRKILGPSTFETFSPHAQKT